MERLSNKMNRVVRLTNWRDPIIEGYFPKLDNIVANRVYPSRPQNAKLQVILKYYLFYGLIIIKILDSERIEKCNGFSNDACFFFLVK